MRHRIQHFLSILLFATSTAQADVNLHSLVEIRDTAVDAVRATLDKQRVTKVEAERLDPRLRLIQCSQPLSAIPDAQAQLPGRLSVNIRCEGESAWSLFVPVQVREQRAVAVTTAALAAGHRIETTDIKLEPHWLDSPNASYFEDVNTVVGKLIARPLAAGAMLPLQSLKAVRAVRRGAAITVAVASGPVAIRASGIAMQDGAVGDRIQVRNGTSKRIVEGTVAEDGSVVVR